ncbi:MAG: radical SAM protein [Elusimicrobia bacterium]|nr:radical SAM protein [Elusimicrobiota bacterium]
MANGKMVLLLNAPCDNRFFVSRQAPLGLLYIASYLRKHGVAVSLLDLNVMPFWRGRLNYLVKRFRPAIIGVSVNYSSRKEAVEICGIIKAADPGITIVLGGPQPTISPGEFSASRADYIIPYEGERAMLEFARAGSDRSALKNVFSCRDAGLADLVRKSDRYSVEDLNNLPFPAYDLIDIRPYYINSYKRKPIVSVLTSRGCPNNCIFCSQAVSGRSWRARSAGNVADEFEWLTGEIGAAEISIEDDNFTADIGRVYEFCGLLRKRGISVPWQLANGVRADRLTRDLLCELKGSGCWKIAIAPEVGDDESMKRIRKGMNMEHFRKAARWCRETGMVYYAYFLMGFPFQGEKELRAIIDFAEELDPLLMDLSKIVPFPGTEIYDPLASGAGTDISYYYRGRDPLVERYYRKAYLDFYLRPGKLRRIISAIGLRQFYSLLRYACRVLLAGR